MKKYVFLISACLFSLVASLCMAQNLKSIEGTTWRGIDNGRETEVTFLPNGAATYSFHNGVSVMTNNNIKWTQNGNNVYWEINNKFVEKNGQVRGDTFSGTAKNIKGLDWKFSYKLVPPNAPLFNPSKELALEQNKLMAQRQSGSPQAQPPARPASPQQAQPQNSVRTYCAFSDPRAGLPPVGCGLTYERCQAVVRGIAGMYCR
jgi:hypothetical protein